MLPASSSDGQRLSRIETLATMIRRAHQTDSGIRTDAQAQLLERYSVAVHRYLLGATRDEALAGDLFQEFAVRFLRGDFRHFEPDRGRFRHYLKTALSRLVSEFRRRHRPLSNTPLEHEPAAAPDESSESDFLSAWRNELFDAAWARLQQYQQDTGQPDYTVLRYRIEHPELRSQQLVDALGPLLGPHVDVNWMRKRLHHARHKFGDYLLEHVAESLDAPSRSTVEEELADLELLEFCRDALARWSPKVAT